MILDGQGVLRTAEADPDSYIQISETKVFGRSNYTSPVYSNGRIYCRNVGGDLVCVDGRA